MFLYSRFIKMHLRTIGRFTTRLDSNDSEKLGGDVFFFSITMICSCCSPICCWNFLDDRFVHETISLLPTFSRTNYHQVISCIVWQLQYCNIHRAQQWFAFVSEAKVGCPPLCECEKEGVAVVAVGWWKIVLGKILLVLIFFRIVENRFALCEGIACSFILHEVIQWFVNCSTC